MVFWTMILRVDCTAFDEGDNVHTRHNFEEDSRDRIPTVDLCKMFSSVRPSCTTKRSYFSEDAIKLPESLINFLTWLVGGLIYRNDCSASSQSLHPQGSCTVPRTRHCSHGHKRLSIGSLAMKHMIISKLAPSSSF